MKNEEINAFSVVKYRGKDRVGSFYVESFEKSIRISMHTIGAGVAGPVDLIN